MEQIASVLAGPVNHIFFFLPEAADNGWQVAIIDIDPEEGSHGCLYGFRVVKVHTIFRTEDVADPEPVCQPDDGTQVPGLLDGHQHFPPVVAEGFDHWVKSLG